MFDSMVYHMAGVMVVLMVYLAVGMRVQQMVANLVD